MHITRSINIIKKHAQTLLELGIHGLSAKFYHSGNVCFDWMDDDHGEVGNAWQFVVDHKLDQSILQYVFNAISLISRDYEVEEDYGLKVRVYVANLNLELMCIDLKFQHIEFDTDEPDDTGIDYERWHDVRLHLNEIVGEDV